MRYHREHGHPVSDDNSDAVDKWDVDQSIRPHTIGSTSGDPSV